MQLPARNRAGPRQAALDYEMGQIDLSGDGAVLEQNRPVPDPACASGCACRRASGVGRTRAARPAGSTCSLGSSPIAATTSTRSRTATSGELFLEVVPMSFTVKVKAGHHPEPAPAPVGPGAPDRRRAARAEHRRSDRLSRRVVDARGRGLRVRWPVPERGSVRGRPEVRRLSGQAEQRPARARSGQRLPGRGLLGAGRAGGRPADPRAGPVLSPRVARAGPHPADVRRRDGRLRPHERRAPDPLRGLLRSRASATSPTGEWRGRPPSSRSARTTCHLRWSTASGCAS